MSLMGDILARRELLANLIARNLKSRYKDSVLGFLWSILTPLFMALIYLVFLRILAKGVPMADILIGVFAWQYTAQCVTNGLTAITDNGNLIKKVYFPRLLLPLTVTLANLINFLLTLVVQFALVAILLGLEGRHFAPGVLAVPLVIVAHTLFCFALAVALSALTVYFRDVQHLINVAMTAWFFLTPAMYSLSLVVHVAQQHQLPYLPDLYLLNPMAIIIEAYRALILPGATFYWSPAIPIAAGLALLLLIAAVALFQKWQRTFTDLF